MKENNGNYKLTFIDKIMLSFKNTYDEKIDYLYPKVYKKDKNWFEINELRLPYNYSEYIYTKTKNILFIYENNLRE